jgi:hypothetical protein
MHPNHDFALGFAESGDPLNRVSAENSDVSTKENQ